MSETHIELAKLGGEIAAHLDGWSVEADAECAHHASLVHRDGGRVSLWYDRRTRKMRVSGQWPRGRSGGLRSARDWRVIAWDAKEPSVNVSLDREPKAIARDIERRFLGRYLEMYGQVLKVQAEEAACAAQLEDSTAKLERAVGRIGSRCSSDGNELSIYFSEPGDSGYIAGSCRVSGTSTHFDRLTVPNHIAEQILALLAAASSET